MDVACGRWPHKKLGLRCGRTRRPAGYGWHGVYFCSVGRGLGPAVAVCPAVPFLRYDRVRSMRRGGNHAARRNTAALDVAGAARCLFCIVGRGLDLRPKGRRCAAVGHLRAKSRALRPGCAPKRRCGASPKRACGRSARRTDKIFKNVQCAAGSRPRPTERGKRSIFPQTPRGEHPCREAYMPPLQTRQPRTRAQKRCHWVNARGPHACGPYRPAGNGR